ncbi:MAG: prepilin-type N-terminal cleavage/methylation domain-containing protein [Kiritimatiellae bacterium]|jgi:prepilin-type N-terminal cleavage/methylation domain-containing protein|nr:prepilin-type N-terminal cleavage/methylation domain-containing protein [Kiritimatiellia bacterium]
MTLNKRGFTLVELIVVIAMIAVFMASVGTAVGKTRERARVEKARGDVKVLSQAILAWENYSRNGKNELREMNDVEADSSSLGFLLGQGESANSGDIPVLAMVQLSANGKMLDPWGRPYLIRIKEGKIDRPENLDLGTCYYLPNFYRLTEEERK